MKLKSINNTVFRNKSKAWDKIKTLTMLDFLEKFNYYFTGTDLEKVIRVERTWKLSLIHLKIITESGVYENNLRIINGGNKGVRPNYEKIIPAYETVEEFMIDFKETTKDDFRILETYKDQLKKKENQLKEASLTAENINKKWPEYLL